MLLWTKRLIETKLIATDDEDVLSWKTHKDVGTWAKKLRFLQTFSIKFLGYDVEIQRK